MPRLKVYTDGASRGNPGLAAIGIAVYDENDFAITTHRECIGEATNNQAEYKALLKSLELLKKLSSEKTVSIDKIDFFSDSELMVHQVNFDYRINEPELALLNNKFHVLMKKLSIKFTISHINRDKNVVADKLANEALDRKIKQT